MAREATLLNLVAERLRQAELLALGVPLDDHAKLVRFIAGPRCDPLFKTTRSSGRRGRPAMPARFLAVIVAAAKSFEGQPIGRTHRIVAGVLGVAPSAVRDAPKRLADALRSADLTAPADVRIERYARFIDEAKRVWEDVRDPKQEAAAARAVSRRALIHSRK